MSIPAEQVPWTPIEALQWLQWLQQRLQEGARRAIQHDGFSAWWFARHGTHLPDLPDFTVTILTPA